MADLVEIGVLAGAWLFSLLWGLYIVARQAGKIGVQRWTAWLMSKDSEPYMDRLAERVIKQLPPVAIPQLPKVPTTEEIVGAFDERFKEIEEQLAKPVDVDLGPIVETIVGQVVPRVRDEVAVIRSAIEGKIGWLKKIGVQTGDAVAEATGEMALEEAGIDKDDANIMGHLENMLNDSEWTKKHPGAALGLRLLKKQVAGEEGGGLTLQRRGKPGRGLLSRRR